MKKKVLCVKIRELDTGKFWSRRKKKFTKVGHMYRGIGVARQATFPRDVESELVVYFDTGYVETIKLYKEREIEKMSFNKAIDIDSIDMVNVESSQINKVGLKDGVMLVEFKGGSKYIYTKVDDDTFKAVVNAESVGSEFNRRIKSHKEIVCVKIK